METAGNRNLQTRTYKQEIQLIQVARIGQAGRRASIDAGAFGLAARWMRRWVNWGCTLMRTLKGELNRLISSLTVGTWRSLRMTEFDTYQGASIIFRKTLDWNVLIFQCLNWMLYPRVECRMSKWVWVLTYFLNACSVVARETACPQSCSPAMVVELSPAYTAVTWQWVYMSHY
jgi:hypothetical protein